MNYKEILQIFKEFDEDMRCRVLPLLLTTLIVIIYAFSMMVLSPFILIFAGLSHIFRIIKNRYDIYRESNLSRRYM